MALISCPECKHMVSDSAQLCPQCGYNIFEYLNNKHIEEEKNLTLNKKRSIEKQKEEYYNQQYHIIYDSISIPSHPNNIKVYKIKNRIKLITIINVILFLINTFCFIIYKFNFNSFVFVINLLIFCFIVYDCIVELPDAKKAYNNEVNNYENIMLNPDIYKDKLTRDILAEDQQIIKFNNEIKKYTFEENNTHIKQNINIKPVSMNIPHCPTCGSRDIEKISVGKKMKGGFFFGIFSSDVRNQFKCKNCGYKW